MNKNKAKSLGSIYTPEHIVKMMLDYGGYVISDYIRKKHVIDNSCGDGQFLKEIVKRYLQSCDIEKINVTDSIKQEITAELSTYIHGIEIDDDECEKCKNNLSSIAKEYGITNVKWDIRCDNSLTVTDYDGKMDFVFGNPPYVRTHNLKDSSKETADDEDYQIFRKFSFTEKGMADLYLAFYELGLKMRNQNGVLCYIAPSPWIYSLSGKNMRKYVENSKELSRVIDFESTQIFDAAQTYVMITLFDNHPHAFISYDKYNEETKTFYSVSALSYEEVFINHKMYFAAKEDLKIIRDVEKTTNGTIVVKNGYATLADDIFIDNLPQLSKYTIDIIKASTGVWKKCLFPYDQNLHPIPLNEIKENAEDVYQYIIDNMQGLKDRTYDKSKEGYWHLIGRSQGLNDTFKNKIALNSLVKKAGDVKINEVKAGQGVYSGMYILTDLNAGDIDQILNTDKFINYVKSLRKYKSGGYYTFSTSDVEKYLNYAAIYNVSDKKL